MAAATPTRRRWFRFSLRTMLALFVVVAIPLAWITAEWRQSKHERQVAQWLVEQGVKKIDFAGPYDVWQPGSHNKPQAWWRRLAREVLGERIIAIWGKNCNCADLSPLAGLTNVQSLDLMGSAVMDVSPLAGLTKLRDLQLNGCKLSDLRPLAGLMELRRIRLEDTRVTDLAPLARLANLRILYLNNTAVHDLTPLAELANLQELNLYGTNVTELSPLAGLQELHDLSLYDTQVRDVSPLAGLTKLKYLCLMESLVTRQQVEALQESLPNCPIQHDPFP